MRNGLYKIEIDSGCMEFMRGRTKCQMVLYVYRVRERAGCAVVPAAASIVATRRFTGSGNVIIDTIAPSGDGILWDCDCVKSGSINYKPSGEVEHTRVQLEN